MRLPEEDFGRLLGQVPHTYRVGSHVKLKHIHYTMFFIGYQDLNCQLRNMGTNDGGNLWRGIRTEG